MTCARLGCGLSIWLIVAGFAPSPKVAAVVQDVEPLNIKVGSILNCNHILKYVTPIYSNDMKQQHIKGVVTFHVVIAKTGELRNIKVVKGDVRLVPAALKAVRQWRYNPCRLNSEPVEVITSIDVDFTLDQ